MLTTLPSMLTYIIRFGAYVHLCRHGKWEGGLRVCVCFTILNWGNVGKSKSKWYEECSLIWFGLELATLFVPSCYSSCFCISFDSVRCMCVCVCVWTYPCSMDVYLRAQKNTFCRFGLVRWYAYDFKHSTDTYDSLSQQCPFMTTVLYRQQNDFFIIIVERPLL